jgi:ribosome-binding protein aMBF1 (putative translation factor)
VPPRLASEAPTPLREALERAGLSQAALARQIQCDRRDVGRYVSGEHTPESPERREQIARAVQATAQELWPDADRGVRAA